MPLTDMLSLDMLVVEAIQKDPYNTVELQHTPYS